MNRVLAGPPTMWILAAAGVIWGATQTTPPTPSEEMAVLITCALLLELVAVELKPWGVFGFGLPFYLVGLCYPTLGLAFSIFLVVAALLLRMFLVAQDRPLRSKPLEVLLDLFPVLLTGVLVEFGKANFPAKNLHFLVPVVAMLSYLVSWYFIRHYLQISIAQDHMETVAWVRRRLHFPVLALCFMTAPLMLLMRVDPLFAIWLLPPVAVIRFGVNGVLAPLKYKSHEPLVQQLADAQQRLHRAESHLERTGQELYAKFDQLKLLRNSGRRLLRNPDLKSTFEIVLKMARELSKAETVALFLHDQGRLSVVSFAGDLRHRVKEAALLQLKEPVVELAWEKKTSVVGAPDARGGERIFVGQDRVLALPVGSLGVLYMGSATGPEFEEHNIELLSMLSDQSAVAIESAKRYKSQQEALKLHSEAHRQLQDWVNRLNALLEGSRALASTLELSALLTNLEALIEGVVPHDGRWVILWPSKETRHHPTGAPRNRHLDDVCQVVIESGHGMIIDDLKTSKFQGLGFGYLSMLASPLFLEGECLGILVLASNQPQQFDRTSYELLQIISYQAAGALKNAHLHHEAVEAYARLKESEAQLFQSSKMAAVGQLAAGVAHELNSPLGAARLAIDFGLRQLSGDAGKAEKSLRKAHGAISRAETVISKLLHYSREATAEEKLFSIDEVVRDTVDFLSHHLKVSKVEIEVDLGSGSTVQGNQNELHQVVANLVLNARDSICADAQAQKWIGVSTRCQGGFALIEVTDRGPGIDPEAIRKVFDPFFTTKAPGEGTGLGLSVSQQIMSKHQGELSVTSQPYEKTTFVMKLPVAAAEADGGISSAV